MTAPAAGRIVVEPGTGIVEIFPMDPSEAGLVALCMEIFREHWEQIRFGLLIQGAVYEIKAPGAPQRVGMLDGYLTVNFGDWHLHLCIGEHKGTAEKPVEAELARHRRTARAEFYRVLDDAGHAVSWGFRLFNGHDEQQLTVFLPNPFLSDEDEFLPTPDWSRLALWDQLRAQYVGLDPDPRDRLAERFVHG